MGEPTIYSNSIINESFATAGAAPPVTSETSIKQLLWSIVKMSAPLSASQLAQFSLNTVMVAFAGRFGTDELGGAGLALGLINATGYAFGSGLCGALETFLSNSYGCDRHSKMYGVYAQRMTLLLLLFSLPLMVLLYFMGPILQSLGQDANVVHFTSVFCRVSIPGIPCIMFLELLRRYYACQHVTVPLTVTVVVAACLNPLLLWGFTSWLGFAGVPVAWVVVMLGMDLTLVIYLWMSGLYKDTWGGLNLKHATSGWKTMLMLALPALGMTFSEWAAMEINGVCAGFADPQDLAAFAITVQVGIFCWGIPCGVYVASSVLIGNAIGEKKSWLVPKIVFATQLVVFLTSIFDIALMLSLRSVLPRAFSDDPYVIEKYKEIVMFFLMFHAFDTFQSNMLGVLRGCGLQKIGAVIISLSFSVVGVPSGLLIFFLTNFGVRALWIGPMIGVFTVGYPSLVYLCFKYIKWNELKPKDESPVYMD